MIANFMNYKCLDGQQHLYFWLAGLLGLVFVTVM